MWVTKMQLQSNQSVRHGYTIIEILIVLVIMSLFLQFGYARYRDFANRQAVDIAARQLTGDLRLAQSSALSGTKPTSCTDTLLGYALTFTGLSGPAEYTISAICKNPVSGNPPIVTSIDSMKLTDDISLSIVSPLPSPYEVIFRPVTLGTNIPANNSIVVTVRNASGTATKTVTISSTGEIK